MQIFVIKVFIEVSIELLMLSPHWSSAAYYESVENNKFLEPRLPYLHVFYSVQGLHRLTTVFWLASGYLCYNLFTQVLEVVVDFTSCCLKLASLPIFIKCKAKIFSKSVMAKSVSAKSSVCPCVSILFIADPTQHIRGTFPKLFSTSKECLIKLEMDLDFMDFGQGHNDTE